MIEANGITDSAVKAHYQRVIERYINGNHCFSLGCFGRCYTANFKWLWLNQRSSFKILENGL